MRNFKEIYTTLEVIAEKACKMEWGSEEQISAEILFFKIAKDHGWDCESDDFFMTYALKAITEEMFTCALDRFKCFNNLIED